MAVIYKFTLIAGILILYGCVKSEFDVSSTLNRNLIQVEELIDDSREADKLPRALEANGEMGWAIEKWDWTEGFFPGICWMAYEYSSDENFKVAAEHFQEKFIEHRNLKLSHDLGFVFNNSFGKAYRITNNDEYLKTLIDAGNTLVDRYNENVGCIQSWNVNQLVEGSWMKKRGWEFPVIIDNMMNLELLFELTEMTGDSIYYNIAVTHANTTLKNHFRPDHSSYHVIDYDEFTGKVRMKETAQGYAHESTWSRGQAWGLYGYTMAYRYTKDSNYLDKAENIADFIMSHKNLPENLIPYWDFNAPRIPNELRDASAAAIMASAFIELHEYSTNDYLGTARNILSELSSEEYLVPLKADHNFLLDHSVGAYTGNREVDVPIIYADYYYLEAMLRLKDKTQMSEAKYSEASNLR